MSSIKLYNQINVDSYEKLKAGQIAIDNHLNQNIIDNRKGISLIIPIRQISEKYNLLIQDFMEADPNQYYYPLNDIHITLFDFIQGSTSYKMDKFLESYFIDFSNRVLKKAKPFFINFEGVVFSTSAGIIKGYDNNQLIIIRDEIRKIMSEFHISNNERYKSESAHITFTRFKNKIMDLPRFLQTIDRNRIVPLGKECVIYFELVEHDWYNSLKTKRVISAISLVG